MVVGFSKQERVVGYGVFAGVVLTIIGIRFLVWPSSAAFTFGLGGDGVASGDGRYGLFYVIGLRDIWLGLLIIGFAWARAFSPLSLWFLLGACVCFGDALTVVLFGGPTPAVVFHVLSGVFCGGAGLAARACATDEASGA